MWSVQFRVRFAFNNNIYLCSILIDKGGFDTIGPAKWNKLPLSLRCIPCDVFWASLYIFNNILQKYAH